MNERRKELLWFYTFKELNWYPFFDYSIQFQYAKKVICDIEMVTSNF